MLELFENKISALVASHLERVPADRVWLMRILRTPRAETTREMVDAAPARKDGPRDNRFEGAARGQRPQQREILLAPGGAHAPGRGRPVHAACARTA